MIHVARFDLVAAREGAFLDWYREEHLPVVLAEPGWEAAWLYEARVGEPRHLAIFDLDPGLAVGGRSAANPLAAYPTDHDLRNYEGETLSRIAASGEDPRRAELLNLIVVDVEPGRAERFSAWYDEVHVPEILACPGWLGNERYASRERPGRFLAMYGLSDSELPFGTPEYHAAVGWDEHLESIRGYHGFRIYSRTGSAGGAGAAR